MMRTNIFFFVILTGLLLVSCDNGSNRLKWRRQHLARIELTLSCNTTHSIGVGVKNTCLANAIVARGKVKNIVVGVFRGNKILIVQNLTNPKFDGINEVACFLADSTPYTNCTAVVVANILSSSAITALKSATSKADFLAIRSSLKLPADGEGSVADFPLSGNIVNRNNGNSLLFTLVPGASTSGLSVELSRMFFQHNN